MTIKALLEVLVHLDLCRNIDLFFQGVYFLKLRMYRHKQHPSQQSQSSPEVIDMQPYWSFEN